MPDPEIIRVDEIETTTLRVGGILVLGGETGTLAMLPEDPTLSEVAQAIRELQQLMIAKGLSIAGPIDLETP